MLKIWLPLNGDLHNQGLADVTVTNNGATINNSGKIGKCYEFGSSKYLSINNKIIDSDTFTVSFWIYANNITGNKCLLCCRNAINKAFAIYLIGAQIRVDTGTNWSTSYSIAATTWTHITFVNNGSKQELYINGSLEKTRSATIDTSSITQLITIGCEHINGGSIGTYFFGCINDVRIYDNVLSPKEIKELSKGLVLHYPLNRGGFGRDNIIKNSNSFAIIGSDYGSATSRTFDYNTHIGKIEVLDTTKRWNAWSFIKTVLSEDPVDLTTGINTYTYSVDIRVTNYTTGTIQTSIDFRTSSPTVILKHTLQESECDGNWHRISATATTNDQKNAESLVSFSSNNTIHGSNTVIEYKNLKLERGDKATPWIPNSADNLYSAMGLDDNVEYDVSGYGNNGVQNNTPTFSSDTPRYKTSIHFNGTNQTVKLPNLSTLIPDSIFTFNVWFKRLEAEPSSKSWETILGGPSGFELESCSNNSVHDSKIKAYSWGGGTFSFEFDKWNMLTMVQNGTNALFYLNGELKLTGTFKALVSGNYFLGSWRDTTSQNYRGYMSDARIYSTALSPDDILALYHTPTSIASNGTLLTQGEIAEV